MVVSGRLAGRHAGGHARAGHRAASSARSRRRRTSTSSAAITTRRRDHDLRQPEGLDAGPSRSRTSGTRCARASATCATPCRRAWSAPASTTSSATPSASSTASPPTASRSASCATTSRTCARRLLHVPDVSKIELLGAQDETHLHRVLGRASSPGWASTRPRCSPRCGRRTWSVPSGTVQTERGEAVRCGSPARSTPRRTSSRSTSSQTGAWCGWATSPRSGAATSIRRSRCSGSTASPRSGSRIAMRDGGDILALGDNLERDDGRDHGRPAGRHRAGPGRQPVRRGRRGDRRVHDLAVAGDRRSSW